MPGKEEAGCQPGTAPASARPDTSSLKKTGQPGAWRPPLQDEEVDAVEGQIIEDDLGDPQDQARIESARRRLADQALLGDLIACDFSGPLYEVTVTEFAAYGIAIMMAWTRTGQIFRQCAAKGRALPMAGVVAGQWNREDRLEVALETTACALRFFIGQVLRENKWDHRRGATLKTFFFGACLLQFPNVFDKWAREQKRWTQVIDPTGTRPGEDTNGGSHRDARWADPTAEAAIRSRRTQDVLSSIKNHKTRQAVWLVYGCDYTHAEAGQATGLSPRAVEGRLSRLHRRSP